MKISRRHFLASVTALAGAAVGGALLQNQTTPNYAALAAPTSKPSGLPKGLKILTAGREAGRYPYASSLFDAKESVVTAVDVDSGAITQQLVPVQNAHHIIALPERGELLIPPRHFASMAITDLSCRKIIKQVSAPSGYLYSGHAVVLPNKNIAIFSLFDESQKRRSVLGIFDLQSQNFIDLKPSSGTEAHDMALLNNSTQLAVGHYGVAEYDTDSDSATSSKKKRIYPSLSRFNLDTFEEIDSTEVKIKGRLSHVCSDNNTQVFGVVESYINATPNNHYSKAEIAKRTSHLMGEKPWALSPYDILNADGIAIPTGMLEFQVGKKGYTHHFINAHVQRRPQSIIFHKHTGKTIAAYVYSSQFIVLSKDGSQTAHPAHETAVPYPIGLSDIAGTPYFVAAGMMDNISIIDARNMKLVAHYPCHLFRSSHTTIYQT